MPDTTLPNTGMLSILVGGSENTWGNKVDANFGTLDNLFAADGTGHDHSELGSPIPSGGLKSLTGTAQGVVAAHGDGTFELATFGTGLSLSTLNVLSLAIHGMTAKTTPVDADEFFLADSAASFAMTKVTRASLLTGAVLAGTPYALHAIGATSGSVALAADTYGVFSLTPTGTTTLSITGAAAGKAYLVTVVATNFGAFTVNFPSGTVWPGGSKPSFSPAGTDILFLLSIDGGTTWGATAQIGFA